MLQTKGKWSRTIGVKIQSAIDAARGKKRVGPFFPEEYGLVKDISRLRDRLSRQEDKAIRDFLLSAMSTAVRSHSQIFQDAFVVFALSRKTKGFFCEFGAADGKTLSNSYLLEHDFGWKGICAEPATGWHSSLRENRPNAHIDTRCVWTHTGETLTFRQTDVKELSTVDAFADGDQHSRHRQNGLSYSVETISLNDLLVEHDAPVSFDYLSIDTEGSEFRILENFDFNAHRPKIITVEHNFTESRNALYDLLTKRGYERVLAEYSQFDDWYVDKQAETYFSKL